ncbi:MAG TPA: hypothetical protein VHA06_19955 [Candidatus Angelobacter sp.]|jgi:hypothetical protein|nr:hypothetical protein [Candidatus Angelobacter sp.]
MNNQQNPIELLIICAVIVILSVLGIVGGLSAKLFGTLDGLLMLAVCLMVALIFSLLLVVLAKDQGWLGKHRQDGGPASPAAAGH